MNATTHTVSRLTATISRYSLSEGLDSIDDMNGRHIDRETSIDNYLQEAANRLAKAFKGAKVRVEITYPRDLTQKDAIDLTLVDADGDEVEGPEVWHAEEDAQDTLESILQDMWENCDSWLVDEETDEKGDEEAVA